MGYSLSDNGFHHSEIINDKSSADALHQRAGIQKSVAQIKVDCGLIVTVDGQQDLINTLYHAIKGQGAWRNEQALKPVATDSQMEQTRTFITDKSFAQDRLYQSTLAELDKIANDLGYAGCSNTVTR